MKKILLAAAILLVISGLVSWPLGAAGPTTILNNVVVQGVQTNNGATTTFNGTVNINNLLNVISNIIAAQLSTPQASIGVLIFTNPPTGQIAVTNLASGVNANAGTFWRGDGTWAVASATNSPSTNIFPGGIFVYGTGTQTSSLISTNNTQLFGNAILTGQSNYVGTQIFLKDGSTVGSSNTATALQTAPASGIILVSPSGLHSGTLTWGNDNVLHAVAN